MRLLILLLLSTRLFAEWELSVDDVKKLSKQPTPQGTQKRGGPAPRRVPTRPGPKASSEEDTMGLSLPSDTKAPQKRPAISTSPSTTVDLSKPSPPSSSGAVDLSRPVTTASPTSSPSARSEGSYNRPSFGTPNFKIIYDLLLTYWPNWQPVTFQNYHSFLLLEIVPAPEVQFSFEVNPTPKFYEFDWNISPKVQFRVGKIWIPFDDMHPHNNFGGVMNTSAMLPPGATPFLPDIWAELGLGLKFTLMDTPDIQSEFHAYITNGFQDGGTDPQGSTIAYPSFGPTTPNPPDNNDDKAIGGRFKASFARRVSVGFSGYTCRYTGRNSAPARFTALGADVQLRPTNVTELRAGYTLQFVGLVPGVADDSFNRGGLYVQAIQKLADRFKLTGSLGVLQPDNRVVDQSDRILVGAILGYTPLPYFETSLNYHRDLNKVDSKVTYDYVAMRFSVML